MKRVYQTLLATLALSSVAVAQDKQDIEKTLCEAAKDNRVVELVYDQDESKGCEPRIVDVHQVAIGNNDALYMHGWQSRGCTKGRDYASKRIFKFEKIASAKIIDGEFGEESQAAKDEGWDGCIGKNCFIKETTCE